MCRVFFLNSPWKGIVEPHFLNIAAFASFAPPVKLKLNIAEKSVKPNDH